MNVGKAIKDLRKQQGFSQEYLAAKAHITQAALSQIENGKRPGITTINNICKVLKISEPLLYIMAIEENDVPEKKRALYGQLFPIIQQMVTQIANG